MKNRLLRFLVKVVLVGVILATILVWQKITVVKMVRANDLMRQKVEFKEETARKVSVEISCLRQRARIEKIATERLGLVPTHPRQHRSIPGEYNLEVSSPGMERPLYTLEQWARFVGEPVQVKLLAPLAGKRKFTGNIEAVNGEEILVNVEGESMTVPFAQVDRATLVPVFD